MTITWRGCPLLLLLLVTLAPRMAAQTSATDPLADLVREGLAQNFGLASARLDARRVALDVRRADAALLPTLDVNARYSEFSGVVDLGALINPAYAALNALTGTDAFPTDISLTQPFRQDMRVQLVQPLFAPDAWAGRSAARARRTEADARFRGEARALAANIRLAWLQAAGAEQTVGIWRAALQVVVENVRVNERLVAAGQATPDALSRARADRAETAQSLADAEREAGEARRALNALVRRPLDAALSPMPDTSRASLQLRTAGSRVADRIGEDPLLAVDSLPPLDDAIASARNAREELAAAAAATRAAAAGTRAATASFAPRVVLAVDYGVQGNSLRFSSDNDFAVASLVVQWNLFNGGSDAVRRQQSQLSQAQARLQADATAQQIERDVRDAHAAARTAAAAVATADERYAAAARTLDLVARRYDEGLASPLEFTDARATWTRAGIAAVLARVNRAARHVILRRAAALTPAVD